MYCKKFRLAAVGLAVCTLMPLGLYAGRGGWSFFSKFYGGSDANGKVVGGPAAEPEQPAPAAEQPAAAESEEPSRAAEGFREGLAWLGDALLWYIPNRICDFVDCFSIELGAGPNAKLDLYITRACTLGGGFGDSYILGWDRRFFGGEKRLGKYFTEFGYDGNFIFLWREVYDHRNWFGNFPAFEVDRRGVVNLGEDEFAAKKEDFWEIGVDLGLLVNAKVMIHPVAIGDFITGLVLIDLESDDHTSLKK